MPVYITAHRGMGVTAKRRDLFIDDAEFYPENSIVAFRQAIEAGADALECDIHVSKDHVAMVMHGNKITDYAYYIGDVGNKQFLPDEVKLCSSFTKQEIQTNFALKKRLVKVGVENFNVSQKIQIWKGMLSQDPNTYKIPTLDELLFLVSTENQERQKKQQPPILLNIELKGKDSGFITLRTLVNFNKLQEIADMGSIVLLGKVETGEIVVAKNLLKWSQDFVQCTEKGNRLELLKKLLGWEDFEKFRDSLAKVHFKASPKNTGNEYQQALFKLKVAALMDSKNLPLELKKQTQEYLYGQIKERIVKAHRDLCEQSNQDLSFSKGDSIGMLRDFIVCNRIHLDLKTVRTNVMLSTGDLYGSCALSGNEDFDLRPDISEISDEGFKIIQECFTQGYDGIDISLFDFDHKSCNAVALGIRLSNNKHAIVGVTASNWKGTVKELSPVTPCMAVQRSLKISEENNIDVLMKVDEPELFKKLLKLLLSLQEEDQNTKLLAITVIGVEESGDEVVIKRDNVEKLSKKQQLWWDETDQLKSSGYDVTPTARPDSLVPSIKPPRGEMKGPR